MATNGFVLNANNEWNWTNVVDLHQHDIELKLKRLVKMSDGCWDHREWKREWWECDYSGPQKEWNHKWIREWDTVSGSLWEADICEGFFMTALGCPHHHERISTDRETWASEREREREMLNYCSCQFRLGI